MWNIESISLQLSFDCSHCKIDFHSLCNLFYFIVSYIFLQKKLNNFLKNICHAIFQVIIYVKLRIFSEVYSQSQDNNDRNLFPPSSSYIEVSNYVFSISCNMPTSPVNNTVSPETEEIKECFVHKNEKINKKENLKV